MKQYFKLILLCLLLSMFLLNGCGKQPSEETHSTDIQSTAQTTQPQTESTGDLEEGELPALTIPQDTKPDTGSTEGTTPSLGINPTEEEKSPAVTEPTQGTKPTEPKPTESTQGTKPTEPKPTESTQGTKPTEPKPTESTQGTKPTEPKPTEPTQGAKPTEPKSTEPTQGTKPTEPKPTEPTQGAKPTEPTEPPRLDEDELPPIPIG